VYFPSKASRIKTGFPSFSAEKELDKNLWMYYSDFVNFKGSGVKFPCYPVTVTGWPAVL
jgi:hypothetical protein